MKEASESEEKKQEVKVKTLAKKMETAIKVFEAMQKKSTERRRRRKKK